MKVQSLHLSIPQPCHEDWDKMTPAENGRHCQNCRKEVIDFSLLSDQQILNLIAQSKSGLCGRFSADQLDRQMFPRPISHISPWTKAGLLAASLLLAVPVVGQKEPAKSDPIELSVQPEYWDLQGKVMDEKGEPLVGASILLHGRSAGTVSDLDGEFIVSLHRSDKQMWVSYTGYRTQEIILKDNFLRNITVVLEKGIKLQEIVVSAPKVDVVASPISGCLVETMGELVLTKTWGQKKRRVKKRMLANQASVKVYPNPFNSNIQIEMGEVKEGNYQLTLISSTGQQVYVSTLLLHPHKNLEVDLTALHLPAGIYWLELSDGKHEHFQQKLIKAN